MKVRDLLEIIPHEETVCIQNGKENVIALNECGRLLDEYIHLMDKKITYIYSERYPAISSRGITITIVE